MFSRASLARSATNHTNHEGIEPCKKISFQYLKLLGWKTLGFKAVMSHQADEKAQISSEIEKCTPNVSFLTFYHKHSFTKNYMFQGLLCPGLHWVEVVSLLAFVSWKQLAKDLNDV